MTRTQAVVLSSDLMKLLQRVSYVRREAMNFHPSKTIYGSMMLDGMSKCRVSPWVKVRLDQPSQASPLMELWAPGCTL